MAREPHFVVKYSSYFGTAIKLVLYILKQLFASVSVNSGGYLPRRSGSVNSHRYSPPLRRIIVNNWDSLCFCTTPISMYEYSTAAACQGRLPKYCMYYVGLSAPKWFKIPLLFNRIGTFFSPLIPCMGVVTFFILFYCKKVRVTAGKTYAEKCYMIEGWAVFFWNNKQDWHFKGNWRIWCWMVGLRDPYIHVI